MKSHLEEAAEAERIRRRAAERFQRSLPHIRALLCAGQASQAAQLIRDSKPDLILSEGRVGEELLRDFERLQAVAERRLEEVSM